MHYLKFDSWSRLLESGPTQLHCYNWYSTMRDVLKIESKIRHHQTHHGSQILGLSTLHQVVELEPGSIPGGASYGRSRPALGRLELPTTGSNPSGLV